MSRRAYLSFRCFFCMFLLGYALHGFATSEEKIPKKVRTQINEYISSGANSDKYITVKPIENFDVFGNPGMGFVEFQGKKAENNNGPYEKFPKATVAYYRWTWAQIEPVEGEIRFDIIDDAIKNAKENGQTIAFRIMPVWQSSFPPWLADKGVPFVAVEDGQGSVFPDHNHPEFLKYQERLIKSLGERYAPLSVIDHIDIGSVGCWGEWHYSCCKQKNVCKNYFPDYLNQKKIIDWYFSYFNGVKLVGLAAAPLDYISRKGGGWRGDCFGDYGFFSNTSNHMEGLYQTVASGGDSGTAWEKAPVVLESCFTMQDWLKKGFDIDRIFSKALDWHVSIVNHFSKTFPPELKNKIFDFQRHIGYRFVLQSLINSARVSPGSAVYLGFKWINKGVAPTYRKWSFIYRFRKLDDPTVELRKLSSVDLRDFLPGEHFLEEYFVIPVGMPEGNYSIDISVASDSGLVEDVRLAIDGRLDDGWYRISKFVINRGN